MIKVYKYLYSTWNKNLLDVKYTELVENITSILRNHNIVKSIVYAEGFYVIQVHKTHGESMDVRTQINFSTLEAKTYWGDILKQYFDGFRPSFWSLLRLVHYMRLYLEHKKHCSVKFDFSTGLFHYNCSPILN